jgi:hypothetical protein
MPKPTGSYARAVLRREKKSVGPKGTSPPVRAELKAHGAPPLEGEEGAYMAPDRRTTTRRVQSMRALRALLDSGRL